MTLDTAIGPLSGYLFQFEKALLLLSSLENEEDFISIEEVDDIAYHSEDGTVLFAIQAKNSIAISGTTFEDTSKDLWRTLQIWIEKLENNTFNEVTKFTCSTNKQIPKTSLLYKITTLPFIEVMNEIERLLSIQKTKLKGDKNNNPEKGKSIKYIIKLIEFVINKKDTFEKIKNNIRIEDNEDVKDRFYNKIHLNSNDNSIKKESIYHEFYGWITSSSKDRWKNGKDARFSKKIFNDKYLQISSNPSIINAIFRTKESFGTILESKIEDKKNELFVKQIEDIKRRKDAKERILRDAIIDFILSHIELAYIITQGVYTEDDFKKFIIECEKSWQLCFDQHVIKENEEYGEKEMNDIAIKVFDEIMNNIEIKFDEGFSFTSSNKYVRNGSFLKLSNIPKIGWRPDWKNKYLKND